MRVKSLLAAVAALSVASMVHADDNTTITGAGFTIPDNTPAGGSSSVAGIAGNVVGVNINFRHSWAGDLVISLSSVSHGSVLLLNRPGFTGTGFGVSSNFGTSSLSSTVSNLHALYQWRDGFAPVPTVNQVAGVFSNANPFGPVSGTFAGLGNVAADTWTLRIVDSAGGDLGDVASWALIMKPIPAPGALALLGIAGLAAGGRRRRA